MDMDIDLVLKRNFVQDLTRSVCGENTELITRPASYMVRNKIEGDRDIHRIILLPPRGYTADKINQTNSHDEAEYATIEIKGAVRKDKNSFSKLRNCLFMASIPENGTTSDLNKPYLLYEVDKDNNPDLQKTLHSAGTAPFAVVRSDGYGFYHNLVNVTDDWLVLQLYKRLRPQRKVDLSITLSKIPKADAALLQHLYIAIVTYGDEVFYKAQDLVEGVCRLPLSNSLPALCEMLYVHDSGKHEACSAFAIILKAGRDQPDEVKAFLEQQIKTSSVPKYYAEQLIRKIEKMPQKRTAFSASAA
jgi:hypothetical protein